MLKKSKKIWMKKLQTQGYASAISQKCSETETLYQFFKRGGLIYKIEIKILESPF